MKNNKKFNRTFQVSLVAVALGLVNQAWAADVACNTNGAISIENQNGATLHQCSINVTDYNSNLTSTLRGINIMNSTATLNNVDVSIRPNEHRGYGTIAVYSENSSINVTGGNYSVNNADDSGTSGYVFYLDNSKVNISNANIQVSSPNGEGLIDGFYLNKNS